MKRQRRRDLMRILHDGTATSQQDIVTALQQAGHEVTQATVSRDLQEVGAVKVRIGDRSVYALPDDLPRGANADLITRSLASTLSEFAIAIDKAAALVVVRTAPGHAAAVARAIDLAVLKDVIGTVAGDDTIFVATPSQTNAERLAAKWLDAAEGMEVA